MSEDGSDKAERGFTLGETTEPEDSEHVPKMDFSTFAISLGTSALYHMGVVKGPDGNDPPQKNLPLARQTIDTLEMLAEKTRGNLDDQETKLMESLLYELRMRFIESDK